MNYYVPPHLKREIPVLSEVKPPFTEIFDGVTVTTNSPYGTIDTLQSLKSAKNLQYSDPTVIQRYSIPVVLKKHPVQCRAPTGMGKTMCFLLPLIETMTPNIGPCICIISPTRELCEQIKEEALTINSKLSIECLYGGMYNRPRTDASIIVGAPGKILNYLENKRISFGRVNSFVLDEADKLLEMGFERDVLDIKSHVPETASVFLFSATFPKKLDHMIERVLPKNKVMIEIENETQTNIKQIIVKVQNKEEKLKETLEKMYKEESPRIIIFAEKKVTVSELHERITKWGFACASLQGDMLQPERQMALNKYKSGKVPILVATSVAARGIDVKDVHMVINYDMPRDSKEYIHRIGRTGRQGKEGTALSFVTSNDMKNTSLMAELVEALKESHSEVPRFLNVFETRDSWTNNTKEADRTENRAAKIEEKETISEKAEIDEDLSGGW